MATNKYSVIHSLHILGLKPGADARQIRAAFRRLVRAHHPDIVGMRGARKFEQITEAYALLKTSDNEPEIKEEKKENVRESFFAKWKRERAEKIESERVRESERTKHAQIEQIINAADKKISSIIEREI